MFLPYAFIFPLESLANQYFQLGYTLRSWTLQELLAPPTVKFFSKDGKQLGSKISLKQKVYGITKDASYKLEPIRTNMICRVQYW